MLPYFLRVTPATLVIFSFLLLLPKKFTEIRIITYILLFIVFRDAMTPTGLWEISANYLLRFHASPFELVTMGIISCALVLGINALEPELKHLLVYFRGKKSHGIISGVVCALLIAGPVVFYYRAIGEQRTSPELATISAILTLTLLGNFLEEALFRGYLQGYLESRTTATRAAVLSGVFFSVAHSSLATVATPYMVPILGFTLYEGLICAFVRKNFGVIPSTLAHGGAIFLIASGIV